jgi:hypothetical protein
MGIRNWVKILLASTPLSPFTTAKKTWSKLFCNCFFEVHSYLKYLPMEKKECPNPIIIIQNMEFEDLVKEMLPFKG